MSAPSLDLFKRLSALVIDDQAAQRTMLRSQLMTMGVPRVDQANNDATALAMLRKNTYDIVLCDYNLQCATTGQQILEHLRSTGGLAPSTLFVMITGESDYAGVATAGEQAPDAYILKPITLAALETRLTRLLERVQALTPVFERLNLKDYEGAIRICTELQATRTPYILEILRRKAESHMALGQHELARKAFQEAYAFHDNLTWARLGEAQTYRAEGNLEKARQLTVTLMAHKDNGGFVRGYDLLAEIAEQEGDVSGALRLLQASAKRVPSPKRMRSVGEVAMRAGEMEVARDCFQRAYRATKGSVTSRPQDVVSLATAQIETGQHREALELLGDAQKILADAPDLHRSALALTAQAHYASGDQQAALAVLDQALQSDGPPGADTATLSLAKAALQLGRKEQGLKLLSAAVAADHENTAMVKLARQVLHATGNDELSESAIEAQISRARGLAANVRQLFSNGKYDEAVAEAERVRSELPNNTAVLLEAAQVHLLWLRFNGLNLEYVDRIRGLLARLDTLMPESDRVAKLHRALRQVLSGTKGD